jgi:hypothetical protein
MSEARPPDFEPWEDAAFSLWRGSRCPSPDLLLPALEGTLEEPTLGRVSAHVATCAVCQELTAALESAAASGPTQEERARLDARRPQTRAALEPKWWLAAVAASAMLIAGTFWFTRFSEFRTMSVPSTGQTAGGKDSVRQFVLPLEAPIVDLPEAPIVLRGSGPDPFVSALIEAAAPLRKQDYAASAREMAALRRKYPDRPHPAYYGGVSLLLSGKPADAIEPLEDARRLSEPRTSLHDQASWYLAVAFERAGRRSDAVTVLTQMCGTGGALDERACVGLHELVTPRIGRLGDAPFPIRRSFPAGSVVRHAADARTRSGA